MRSFLIRLIKIYQHAVSPLLGPRCRFYPSCSHYAVDALNEHGALKGTALAIWRVLRCNPLSKGGIDEVPARDASSSTDLGAARHG